MKERKRKITPLIVLALLLCTFSVLYISGTYARYTSEVSGTAQVDVAKWAIKVNGTDITPVGTTSFGSLTFLWDTNTRVVANKIAPARTATAQFTLDPTGTEVAFEYEIDLGATISNIPTNATVTVKDGTTTIVGAGGKYTGVVELPAGAAHSSAHTITVIIDWPNIDTAVADAADTVDGVAAKPITFPVSVTVKQLLMGE